MKLSDVAKGLEKTKLLYLDDSYATTFQGSLLRMEYDRKKNVYIVLDKTLFHPKGGGQPTDTGLMYTPSFKVNVKKAMYFRGVVVHAGKLVREGLAEKKVRGEIEWERRYCYMRHHTAGHLLDHCLTVLTGRPVETTDSWLEDPCYVGYRGTPPTTRQIEEVEEMANQMISNRLKVTIEHVAYRTLLELAPHAPNIYRLPALETYRIVTIEGCSPIPCAGTHLRNIKEIGHVRLDKVEAVDPGFRVYYHVE
jgi:alanyl-tRNA synthetase